MTALRYLLTILALAAAAIFLAGELKPYFGNLSPPPAQPAVDVLTVDSYLYENGVAEVLNRLFRQVFDEGIEEQNISRLNRHEKTVLFAGIAMKQVMSGGFGQYFSSSAAAYVRESAAALASIGALESSQVVKNALLVFPDGQPPADSWKRIEYLGTLDREKSDMLEQQTWAFKATTKSATKLLFDYIERYRPHIEAARSAGEVEGR